MAESDENEQEPGLEATPNHYVQVCKVADHPSVTGSFTYSISSLSPNGQTVPPIVLSVSVGTCTSPKEYMVGATDTVTVTETGPSNAVVTNIEVNPPGREVSRDLANRRVVIRPDGVAPWTTRVTFHNGATETSEKGILKVCKVAGSNVAVGSSFTFSANGGPSFTVPAGPGPGGYCVVAGSFALGTNVTIQENLVVGNQVTAITAASGTLNWKDLPGGKANVTIGPGVTEVTFTDAKVPTGYLEICKKIEGPLSLGPPPMFEFTVSGVPGTIKLPAGACSAPIQVTAGPVTVTELTSWSNTNCTTLPTASLLTNWVSASKTATVTVNPGGVAAQTIVTFTNRQFDHIDFPREK